MNRGIQLFESVGSQMYVRLELDGGTNGTWRALDENVLNYNSGRYRSKTYGLDLLAQDLEGTYTTLVATLLQFWRLDGVLSKESGGAIIVEGNHLQNSDNGFWQQYH
jgi:hypothetical protein